MDSTTESIIKRIKKLLTLANNSGATEAEAKNAMAMAQRLMTKYNISMANVGIDKPSERNIRHEQYFTRKGSLNPADKEIAVILNRFYKVKILFSGGCSLVMVGTPEDIEIAKYVHGYLRAVFFKCWNEFKRSANEISAQAERPEGRDGAKPASQYKETAAFPNKADYYFGLQTGICEKMHEAENSAKSEETQEACKKYELVLVKNKEAIANYIYDTFGKLGRSRRRSASRMDANSFYAGKAKGSTISINQAIKA